MATPLRVHLLDVGAEEYGDSVLLELGGRTVLIDGAHTGNHRGDSRHPSIQDQVAQVLGQDQPPFDVDLLIVSHAHEDHIGCLPKLVADDVLRSRWALVADPDLGFGRSADGRGAPDASSDAAATLAAGLREEPRVAASDVELRAFLVDALSLEERYRSMLQQLTAAGTRVVRHGRDSATGLKRAFKSCGLNILGPTEAQLLICAELVQHRQDSVMRIANDIVSTDTSVDPADLYRMLMSSDLADQLDVNRPGPAVNLQSIVVTFTVGRRRLLFAGDMQLEDPQLANPTIADEIAKLRARIAKDAPYAFVKLSHHGSDNAFSESVLDELGTSRTFGICAGEHSTKHPNRATLNLLDDQQPALTWARTDHNGLVSIDLSGSKPKFETTRGHLNDPRPNAVDPQSARQTSLLSAPSETSVTHEAAATSQSSDVDIVEVITRVPHVSTRVTVSIDVEPGATTAPAGRVRDTMTSVKLAGGRALPRLLFVTQPESLVRNIGKAEAQQVIEMLRTSGHALCDNLPAQPDLEPALAAVRAALRASSDIKGVVLVGGYDVVPSGRVDCLPARLRSQLGGGGDPDEFVVWSDDCYGDTDGDTLAELPVSRIPDGKSGELVVAALGAPNRGTRPTVRCGVRNVARPFAEGIFSAIIGPEPLLVSDPVTFRDHGALDSDHVYLMLHGDFVDGSRFWGEDTPNGLEAVNVGNVPAEAGTVVFTGCCWGALTVDTPANRVAPGRPFGQKTPDGSVALSFLRAGTTGFIGCTGAHYSPVDSPYDYYGGPMHAAFWSNFQAGLPPAAALLEAKRTYAGGMPHRTGAGNEAIELKIFRQYTCLGLGW